MTMVNIDINIKNIENSMLSETPGYIRQLHQMQSLPYSLSPIGLSRKPPFENRSVLRHHSHRRFHYDDIIDEGMFLTHKLLREARRAA